MSTTAALVVSDTDKKAEIEKKAAIDMKIHAWMASVPALSGGNEDLAKQIGETIEFILGAELNKGRMGPSLQPSDATKIRPCNEFLFSGQPMPENLMPALPTFLYFLTLRGAFADFSILFRTAASNTCYASYDQEKSTEILESRKRFRELFEIQKDEFFDVCGEYLLIVAIESPKCDLARYILLRSKRNLSNATWPGSYRNALDAAVENYLYTDIANTLLDMGCTPSANGLSILATACQHAPSRPELFDKLLKHGANVLNTNAKTPRGYQKGITSFGIMLQLFEMPSQFLISCSGGNREDYIRGLLEVMKILCTEGALFLLPEYRTRHHLGPICTIIHDDKMKLFSEFAMASLSKSDTEKLTSLETSDLKISSYMVNITIGILTKKEVALRFVRNGVPSWLFSIHNLKRLLNRFFTHRSEFDEEQSERFYRMSTVVSTVSVADPAILVPNVEKAFEEFDEKCIGEFKAIKDTVAELITQDTSSIVMGYLYILRGKDNVPSAYCPKYRHFNPNNPLTGPLTLNVKSSPTR